MAGSQITGTNYIAGSPTAYPGGSTQLTPAIQTLWSKEILFQAMPILRMEQFAIKKTELGNAPGTSVNFMRYNNLSPANQLVEGIRMVPQSMTGSQFSIQVAEHGKAVATTEFLLNASFDDIMATAARLLGRRSEEHTSELQSPCNLVCRLLLEKKKDARDFGAQHVQQPSSQTK